MKKITICIAALITVMSLSFLQSCDNSKAAGKVLKFNLEVGKGYNYEMVWDMNSKAGEEASLVTIAGVFSMNVTGNENGVRSVTTAYKSIRMGIKAKGVEIDIDSEKPAKEAEQGDIMGTIIGMMNKVVSGIVGKSFVIKVNEEGKVLEVNGFEAIINGMVDSLDIDQNVKAAVSASLKDQFNEQNLKDQFAQVFTIFPNKEIKVGDTWDKSFSTSGKTAAAYKTTYTVKAIEGDNVTLDTKTKISQAEDGPQMDGTQTGTIMVDSKSGLLINAEFDQTLKATMQGTTVDITGKGKIKGKAN